ncbi:cupin domain-containing protein [Candidatus Nomurabacteria bacterium]|nr:cupin domain-containing protein [Candidatus Nomurabacteria bacterium]
MAFDTTDMGPNPWVVDIEELTTSNDKFRVAKWTGTYFQMTVMSIKPGEEVGLEVHHDVDQFLRLEQGKAKVVMGPSEDNLDKEWTAEDDWAIFVPAGTWHNIINDGDEDLKLYSIYAKPEHPHGTVHEDYAEAMDAEHSH